MIYLRFAAWTLCLLTTACSESDEPDRGPGTGGAIESQPLQLTPVGALNRGEARIGSHADATERSSLMMDYRSYIDLDRSITGNDNPNYARICRLPDGSYLLFNHYGGANNANGYDVYYAASPDLAEWEPRGMLFERYEIVNARGKKDKRVFSNPDAIVLADGEILAFASYRANMSVKYEECRYDHGIVMRRSTDNGRTWSEPQEIYHGLNWEPCMIQLPSGELQCYFSESRQWISGGHSGTGMIVSTDNGATWSPALDSEPYHVIRQHWYNEDLAATLYTDQMPSIVRLHGTDRLAAAVESSVSCTGGNTSYRISFAYSDERGGWQHLQNDETGPADRRDNLFEGAAPQLLQFPSGETVVSYGYASHMNMRMGDAAARQFGEPFVALPGRGSWGCLEPDGSHALIAAMRNSETASDVKIAVARFYLNHRIAAVSRRVRVDGENSEWLPTDEALFVGSRSQAQATLRCACDEQNVYFLVEVLDRNLSKDDYVNILLSPATPDDRITSHARRIKVSHNGLRSTDQYAGGWRRIDMDVRVQAACDGTVSDDTDTDHGYLVEVAVARRSLEIEEGCLRVDLVLFDSEGGEDALYTTMANDIAGWVPVAGL